MTSRRVTSRPKMRHLPPLVQAHAGVDGAGAALRGSHPQGGRPQALGRDVLRKGDIWPAHLPVCPPARIPLAHAALIPAARPRWRRRSSPARPPRRRGPPRRPGPPPPPAPARLRPRGPRRRGPARSPRGSRGRRRPRPRRGRRNWWAATGRTRRCAATRRRRRCAATRRSARGRWSGGR